MKVNPTKKEKICVFPLADFVYHADPYGWQGGQCQLLIDLVKEIQKYNLTVGIASDHTLWTLIFG